MKLLFVVADGGGNIPPQLAVARALRARGDDVRFLGHRGIRERVESAGFPFEPFPVGRHFDPVRQRSLAALMVDFTRVAIDRRLGSYAVDEARRRGCDAIVVDMIMTAGVAEVASSTIPTVMFVHCFYRAVQDLTRSPIGWLLRLRGIKPLELDRLGVLQLVTARADLDPVRGEPSVRHTGVVWQGTPIAADPQPVPRILVSLSTCAYAGQRRMLQNILTAVEPLPVEVTVTVGPGVDATGLRVPTNAAMHAWLDHDEVLARASLVVGHGGHSTTMRALSFGVPLVIMPANPMIDQKRVGGTIEHLGAGVSLPKYADAQCIRAAIVRVLQDPGYGETAAKLGARIRQRDGAEVAANAIHDFVMTRG